MALGKDRIACGPICFALQYRDIDGGDALIGRKLPDLEARAHTMMQA